MPLLVIGLNHRTTSVDLREQLYLSPDHLQLFLMRLQHQPEIDEVAVVSTCNRLEIYAAAGDEHDAEQAILRYISAHYNKTEAELTPYLYIYHGQMVVRHLMRVASGLDSMVLGETQILGQIGTALDYATQVKTIGTLLHRLFEASQHAGKRARTETSISQHTTSVSHAAALLIRNQTHAAARVLLIGAGEMAELAMQALTDFGIGSIKITNRTLKHAQHLGEKFNCEVVAWQDLWDEMVETDVVVAATGAPHPLFYADTMSTIAERRTGQALMMVDIAVPRDIDPLVATLNGINVYDIDALQHIVDESLTQRRQQIPAVEAIVEAEVGVYWSWFNERSIVPVIKDLRAEVQAVVQLELETALGKLPDLDAQGQEIVRRMAHRIINKVLHTPTRSLRAHAAQGDSEHFARAVRDLFALPPDDDPSESNRLYV